MTGADTFLIILGIVSLIVMIIRYKTGDPFARCGRRDQVYAED